MAGSLLALELGLLLFEPTLRFEIHLVPCHVFGSKAFGLGLRSALRGKGTPCGTPPSHGPWWEWPVGAEVQGALAVGRQRLHVNTLEHSGAPLA